jgi:hypothetical protein
MRRERESSCHSVPAVCLSWPANEQSLLILWATVYAGFGVFAYQNLLLRFAAVR